MKRSSSSQSLLPLTLATASQNARGSHRKPADNRIDAVFSSVTS